MSNRPLVIIAAVLGALVLLIYLVIAILLVGNATNAFAPQPTVTRTPTITPRPTFTATTTRTLRVTNTPMPTLTPEPTETLPPLPVAPTASPIPPTPTPRPPTATPVPRPPTATPLPTATRPPYQYTGIKLACETHGGSTSVKGTIRGVDNQPQSKIWVWTWTDGWGGAWYYSGANPDFPTLYYVTIDITAKAGKWYVAVVDGDKSKNRISDIVTYTTDNNSDTGACNDQVVDFKANW